MDRLNELFSLLEQNERSNVRVGERTYRPLLALLEEFGPLTAAASNETDLPWSIFRFERAWVALRLVY